MSIKKKPNQLKPKSSTTGDTEKITSKNKKKLKKKVIDIKKKEIFFAPFLPKKGAKKKIKRKDKKDKKIDKKYIFNL